MSDFSTFFSEVGVLEKNAYYLETVKRLRPENMTVIFEKFQIYPIMLNSMRITMQPLLNHDKLAVMAELAMYIQRFNGSNLKSIIQICDFIAWNGVNLH